MAPMTRTDKKEIIKSLRQLDTSDLLGIAYAACGIAAKRDEPSDRYLQAARDFAERITELNQEMENRTS